MVHHVGAFIPALHVTSREVAIAVSCKTCVYEFFPGNRDFSFRDIERDLKIAMDSIALGISSTFEAEMKKKIARDLLGDYVDENVLERIDREIEGLEGLDNQLRSEGL